MTTAEILERIPGVKRLETGGWTCFCPGHPDGRKRHRASLRLLEKRSGWRCFKCFAGCHEDAILSALRLTRADLAPERDGRTRVISATFDYTDGAGTLRYQVVRFEPKDFQMRRPDGRGGWIYNMDGVERLPYRLPDLVEEPRSLLVEGEGLVETLRPLALPWPATTTPGGAEAWQHEYARQLAALGIQEMVILPDHDEAGEGYARTAARSLRAEGLRVWIVHLPGLQDKQDIVDWLREGHSPEELIALIRGAIAGGPEEETDPPRPEDDPGPQPPDDDAPPPFVLVTPDSFVTKYIRYAQMCTDAPAAAHQLMALGLLSAMAGPDIRIPLAFRPGGLPVTLWTLYVVDSAMGRKSTFEDIGVNLLGALLPPERFFHWEGSPQGLIQRMAEVDGFSVVFPRDEISGLLAQIKTGGHLAGLPQLLIRCYDVHPVENVRTRKKGKGGEKEDDTDRARTPYLVILAASTRDSLLEQISAADYLSGFMPRFLVHTGTADPREAGRLTDAIIRERNALITHLQRVRERAQACPGLLAVDDEVFAAAWDLELRWAKTTAAFDGRASVAGAIAKRLIESVWKVAGLLALDHTELRVTADLYRMATQMAEHWLRSALGLARAASASRFERDCQDVLSSIGKEWTPVHAILRKHRKLRIRHLEEILGALEGQEELERQELKTAKKGPAAQVVRRKP